MKLKAFVTEQLDIFTKDMTKSKYIKELLLLFKKSLAFYNKKKEKEKFIQDVISTLVDKKLAQTEALKIYENFFQDLDFFQQQQLNIYFQFYLHDFPKKSIAAGLDVEQLLKLMIEENICDNKSLLKKGYAFVEHLLADKKTTQNNEMIKQRILDVMENLIFKTKLINIDTYEALSRSELIARLKKCEASLEA